MIRIEIRCQGCGRHLDEPPDLPGEERRPCPQCGSLGRSRAVLMIPGEAGAPAGSPEAAWLDLGSALARAASALDQLLSDDLDHEQRSRLQSSRGDVQRALDEYREANRKLNEL